jgi:hypothetical protein
MLIPLPDYRHFASISAVFGLWIQAEPLARLTGSLDLEENTQTKIPFFSVVA